MGQTDFDIKAKQMGDQAVKDADMSDDEVLAEWEKATQALHSVAQPRWTDAGGRAPGEPLADTLRRPPTVAGGARPDLPERGHPTGANPKGYVSSQRATYIVPVGSDLDKTPYLRAAEDPPDAVDGWAYLERPFSALVTDLHETSPNSPEYRRVKELYGRARIAYLNKMRADRDK